MASNGENNNNVTISQNISDHTENASINRNNPNEMPLNFLNNSVNESVSTSDMEYSVDINNRYSALESFQAAKKSKSSSSINNDVHAEEILNLKIQIKNLQENFTKSIEPLQNRIDLLSKAANDYTTDEEDRGTFTMVKSPAKKNNNNKRKMAWPQNKEIVSTNDNSVEAAVAPVNVATNPALNVGHQPTPGPSNVKVLVPGLQPTPGPSRINAPVPTNSANMPPIFIYNIEVKYFRDFFNGINFKAQIINNNLKKFTLFNLNDFQLVRKALESSELHWYTFTPKSIRPISYIIRGLDSSYDEEEVSLELKSKFPTLKFVKISNFSTKISRQSNKKLNLWIVQLAPESATAEFKKLTLLLHSVVSVELMKPGGVVQCWNCQRFDHIAANCGMNYRCMKCTTPHAPGECSITEQSNFVCVNCGGNHSTNFSGCPKKAARANHNVSSPAAGKNLGSNARRNLRAQDFPNLPTRPLPRPVTASISYANAASGAASGAAPNHRNVQTNNIGFLQNEINSLFGYSMFELLGKIKNFLPIYNNLDDITEKKQALLNFLFDMVNNV